MAAARRHSPPSPPSFHDPLLNPESGTATRDSDDDDDDDDDDDNCAAELGDGSHHDDATMSGHDDSNGDDGKRRAGDRDETVRCTTDNTDSRAAEVSSTPSNKRIRQHLAYPNPGTDILVGQWRTCTLLCH